MNPLLEQFLQEARENLKFIEQNLEELGNGDDEMINAIFRAAHTLKGGSGIVGFESIKVITHKAEDLLDQLRAKKLEYKENMLDALYDAFDEVLNLVEAAEETGDIVQADEGISSKVTRYLDDVMGISGNANVNVWSTPEIFVESVDQIKNFELLSLSNLSGHIPYERVELTEDNFNEKRAYAIFFDVEKSCMVFGNDPLYALSLLEDKVISVATSLDREDAQKIILGKEDEEGLELFLKISAIVNATYEEVEDALYNFIDDIVICPLSINAYLETNKGESSGANFIKDFAKSAQLLIKDDDIKGLKEKSIQIKKLLNQNSTEVILLNRIIAVLDCIDSSDHSKLAHFFTSLEGEKTLEPQKPKVEKSIEVNDEIASLILAQQSEQLKLFKDEESCERVYHIVKKCFNAKGKSFSPFNHSANSLLEALGEKDADDEKQNFNVEKEMFKQEVEVKKNENMILKDRVQKEDSKKDIVGKVVKVEQASIDYLMGVVGELLVAKNSLPYLADSVSEQDSEVTRRAILEKHSFIDRLTNQLQDLTMSMRMLPISYVFDRYPKLVREISKKLGKKVKLIQEGGETKLDKNMIEMLADPLIHIIRNSLDHGIESPAQRKESGKSETGQIMMRAYPESDRVVIEIIDDGKGIDASQVVNKVLEKGLIDPEKLDTMSEEEKLNLIMLPGISTAEQISEYSGRGVGMDVVKKSIETFGGMIHLNSKVGEGTKLVMSIPVSLAVTTLLHVSMNDMHYGFPMDSVSETVKLSTKSITRLNNELYVYIRGQIIPLIVIENMMDMESLKKESISIVVLDVKGNQIAVVVNELLGQLDVVQKPMKGLLAHHSIISGTALLGNGQIIMTIDPNNLWEISDELKTDVVLEGMGA